MKLIHAMRPATCHFLPRLTLPRLLAGALPLLPVLPVACVLLRVAPVRAQPLPERRPITGRITRGDGAGVAKATVTIQREQSEGSFAFWGAQTVTDASGSFSFPEAEDGAYFISVEAEGYSPLQNKPLRVDEGSALFSTRLERLATLSLRLLGPDGAPVKNTRVVVRLSRPDMSTQPLRRQTNALGVLQVRDQSPGTYALEVAAPGAGFASPSNVEVKFAEPPQTLDVRLQQGGSLKVTARDANEPAKYLGGASLSLSATLEPTEEERRAGRLSTRSLANLQSLYAYSPDGSGAVTREGDGILELRDLPPGRYRAKLVLPAYAPSETREVEVKAGQDSAVEFALPAQVRSSSLKVRVLDKNNAPLPNRDWTLQLRWLGPLPGAPGTDTMGAPGGEVEPRGITVAQADTMGAPGGGVVLEAGGFGVLARRARSDDKGEFTLFPIRAGRWRVLAFPAPVADGNEPARAAIARANIAQRDVSVAEEGGEIMLNFRGDLETLQRVAP